MDDLAKKAELYLVKEAAQRLTGHSFEVQKHVVSQLASTVEGWQAHGVVLDPVSYDAVVNALVSAFLYDALTIQSLKETCANPGG